MLLRGERIGEVYRMMQSRELDAALLVSTTAAHEINGPLQPIIGFTELLLDDSTIVNSSAAAKIKAISDAGNVITTVVANLGRIQRLELVPPVGNLPPRLDLNRSILPEDPKS